MRVLFVSAILVLADQISKAIVVRTMSLYESIPSLILKSKNIFENKSINQINLFEGEKIIEEDLLSFFSISILIYVTLNLVLKIFTRKKL